MNIKDAPKLDDWRLGLRHGNVKRSNPRFTRHHGQGDPYAVKKDDFIKTLQQLQTILLGRERD
jgi:hypothetical protein